MHVIEMINQKPLIRLIGDGVVLILFACTATFAQEADVFGRVTFVAGPTVYASVGRKGGITDSCNATIRSGADTVAVLRLIALSSRSSSWSIFRATRDIVIGDTIAVRNDLAEKSAAGDRRDTSSSSLALPLDYVRRMNRQYEQESAITIHGRMSLQYYGIQFEDPAQSLAQPALGFSLGADLRDLPVKFTFYGVQRQRSHGTLSPFDRKSRPETRLYRVSVEYDDGATIVQLGRIYPASSLPMSAVDGASVGRRLGNFTAGIGGGAEPTLTFKYRQNHLWKGMAFLNYQTTTPFFWGAGALYTRSYILSALVRETASLSFFLSTPSGISLTGFSDIDLRRPLSKTFTGDPSLTSLMLLGSARVHPSVSVFAGIDGARSVPSPTDYGVVPDTMINRTLRSGLTTGASVFIQSWLWTINFSPRMGPGSVGKEYSASTSMGTRNLLSTGVEIRSTANLNHNAYTSYTSYGLQARRNDFGVDWRLRFQYYSSTIRQNDSRRDGTVAGVDVVAMIAENTSIMATLDTWRGATYMNVMFFEVSWRF